jgi:hypothetical protein
MHEKWTVKVERQKVGSLCVFFVTEFESIPGSGEIVANGTTCHPVVVQQK